MDYASLNDAERRAVIRDRVSISSGATLLALWRALGLPERDLVEQGVHPFVAQPGEHAQQPGRDGQPIGRW